MDVQFLQQREGVTDIFEQVLVVLDHLGARVHPKPLLEEKLLIATQHLRERQAALGQQWVSVLTFAMKRSIDCAT